MGAASLDIDTFLSPRLISTFTVALSCLTLAVAIARAVVTCRRFHQNFQQSGEGNLCYRGVRYRGPSALSPASMTSARHGEGATTDA